MPGLFGNQSQNLDLGFKFGIIEQASIARAFETGALRLDTSTPRPQLTREQEGEKVLNSILKMQHAPEAIKEFEARASELSELKRQAGRDFDAQDPQRVEADGSLAIIAALNGATLTKEHRALAAEHLLQLLDVASAAAVAQLAQVPAIELDKLSAADSAGLFDRLRFDLDFAEENARLQLPSTPRSKPTP